MHGDVVEWLLCLGAVLYNVKLFRGFVELCSCVATLLSGSVFAPQLHVACVLTRELVLSLWAWTVLATSVLVLLEYSESELSLRRPDAHCSS